LYDRIVLKGESLSDGEIANTNYVHLGSWYLSNINARYVKPIDYDYYKSLQRPIASRLYEILSVKFYGLMESGGKFIRYRYSTLCDLLPVKRQKYFSRAKQIMDPSHKKLEKTGFLSGYAWDDIADEKRDWYIYYFPGERAKDEIKRFKELEKQKPQKLAPPPDLSAKAQAEIEEEKASSAGMADREEQEDLTSSDLVFELEKRNITKRAAKQLASFFSEEYIREKIKMFDYLRKAGSHLVSRNPAGWLRSAIEEDYKLENFEEKLKIEEAEERKKQIPSNLVVSLCDLFKLA